MIYCGIGSRETPDDVLGLMEEIGKELANRQWTLRSGMAEGADQAFYVGALMQRGKCEIYIPWKGFNGANTECIVAPDLPNYNDAMEVSSQFHPAWDKCSTGAKKLHTRNVYQVAGTDLMTPANCVVCWTKNGAEVGGTAQAIRIAKYLEIPVFNLFFDKHLDALNEFVEHTS